MTAEEIEPKRERHKSYSPEPHKKELTMEDEDKEFAERLELYHTEYQEALAYFEDLEYMMKD